MPSISFLIQATSRSGPWRSSRIPTGRFNFRESERIATGDLDPGPPIETRVDEVHRLAEAHDKMRQGLETLLRIELARLGKQSFSRAEAAAVDFFARLQHDLARDDDDIAFDEWAIGRFERAANQREQVVAGLDCRQARDRANQQLRADV